MSVLLILPGTQRPFQFKAWLFLFSLGKLFLLFVQLLLLILFSFCPHNICKVGLHLRFYLLVSISISDFFISVVGYFVRKPILFSAVIITILSLPTKFLNSEMEGFLKLSFSESFVVLITEPVLWTSSALCHQGTECPSGSAPSSPGRHHTSGNRRASANLH